MKMTKEWILVMYNTQRTTNVINVNAANITMMISHCLENVRLSENRKNPVKDFIWPKFTDPAKKTKMRRSIEWGLLCCTYFWKLPLLWIECIKPSASPLIITKELQNFSTFPVIIMANSKEMLTKIVMQMIAKVTWISISQESRK